MLDLPRERVVALAAVAEVLHLRRRRRSDRHMVAVGQRSHRRRRAFRDRHRVALLAVRHRVLVLHMLSAVVLPLAVSALHVQHRLVLRHRQRALDLLDAVVLGQRALVQRVRERVLAAAHHRLAARDGVRRALARDEAVARNRHIGLRILRQRRAVVLLLAVRTRQRNAALRHFQRAVVRRVIVVRIRRLDLVVHCTKVRNARHRAAPHLPAVRAVLDRRPFRYARRRSAVVALAVILPAVVNGLDRHRRLRDLQPPVRHAERHVVVRVRRAEVAPGQTHRVAAVGIAAASNIRARGNRCRLGGTADFRFRQRGAFGDADRVARHALLAAVVGLGVRVTRNRHRQRNRLDLQLRLTNLQSHRVVTIHRQITLLENIGSRNSIVTDIRLSNNDTIRESVLDGVPDFTPMLSFI